MRAFLIAFLFPILALAQSRTAPTAPTPPSPATTPRPATHGTFVLTGETQLFQVVLLRASRRGTDDIDGLPKSAEKALADVRDFLPFKHYRLLDSALVRLSENAAGGMTVGAYDVRFEFVRDVNKLTIEAFQVMPAKKNETPQPPGAMNGGPFFAPEAVKPLISTSFAMQRGETVVVGSSKLNGDDALVVLLTALPGK